MSDDTDGGNAFPTLNTSHREESGWVRDQSPGMSMRDWFAGQAMQSILSNKERMQVIASLSSDPDSGNITDIVAGAAYYQADAMLKARKYKTT